MKEQQPHTRCALCAQHGTQGQQFHSYVAEAHARRAAWRHARKGNRQRAAEEYARNLALHRVMD